MKPIKPIAATFRNGQLTLAERLDLPENTQVYVLLIDPIIETEWHQFTGEKASAEDYFQFEKENNCVPTADELEYYNGITRHESR